MERLATDLKGGQIKQLVRRFAPAIVTTYAISKLTNNKRELSGIDPASSALGVLNPSINPAISSAIETYQQRGPAQAAQRLAGNLTPIPKLIDVYQTANKRKLGEGTLNAFGVKKKKPDVLDGVVKQIKKVLR
jgi:hypothetical protein